MELPIIGKGKQAKAISEKAQKDRDAKIEEVAIKRQETQDALELLGRTKLDVNDRSMRAFAYQFNRLDDVDLAPISKHENMQPHMVSEELGHIDFKAINGMKATMIAGGSGAAAAAVTYATVGSLASASTGTAIGALHGAAATNATMAFLGGGPLAAGGLGMAGGAAVLGGLVAVPILVVGGFVLNSQANKKLNQAKQDAKRVRQFIKESDRAITALEEIRLKSSQLKYYLLALDEVLIKLTDNLRHLIDRYYYSNFLVRLFYTIKKGLIKLLTKLRVSTPDWLRHESRVSISRFSRSDHERAMFIIGLAMVIRALLDTNMINDVGLVSPSVDDVLLAAKTYGEKIAGMTDLNIQ